MQRRRFFVSTAILGIFVLAFGGLTGAGQRGRKFKAPPPTARIEVTVVRADDSKPIENASVIFHTIKEHESMELKSNEDGKTIIDVLPIGETVRLQVIGHGYKTFGQDYPIKKADMSIEVRLKRPGQQYSIYKEHPNDDSQNNDQNKSPDSKDKPKDSSKPQ